MNKFANDLGKTVMVPSESDTYKQLMYNLTLNLGIPSTEVIINSISTIPPNYSGFSKGHNENYLEAWVNKEKLKEDQTIDNLFNIGPDRPMRFLVGNLFEGDDVEENHEYTFIVCRISGMFTNPLMVFSSTFFCILVSCLMSL